MLWSKHPQNFCGDHKDLFLGGCAYLGSSRSRRCLTEAVLRAIAGPGSAGSRQCRPCFASNVSRSPQMRPLRPGLRTSTLPLPPTCFWPPRDIQPTNAKSMEIYSSRVKGTNAGRSEELGPKTQSAPLSKGRRPRAIPILSKGVKRTWAMEVMVTVRRRSFPRPRICVLRNELAMFSQCVAWAQLRAECSGGHQREKP